MTVERVEVGLVSADETIVEFLVAVFEMERLPPMKAGPGVIHRLQVPGAVIKVMIPSSPPTITEPVVPFFGATGLRYLTLFVSDLDGILERTVANGGKVAHAPMEVGPGVRIAVLQDPDGNGIELVEGAPAATS